MAKIKWFKKTPKKKSQEDIDSEKGDQLNADIQGSYTDHHMSSLKIRQQLHPMGADEAEAFEWVLDKMTDLSHEDATMDDLIDTALAQGWFYIGSEGELRVSKEEPE